MHVSIISYCCRYAFVQFESYFAAKSAMEAVNATEIKGRPVAVDWVVPKDQYEQSVRKEGEKGESDEREDEEKTEIEDEDEESDDESDAESHDSDTESHDSGAESHDQDAESRDSDAESCDSDGESHDSAAKPKDGVEADTKRDDVNEGKTLFIR